MNTDNAFGLPDEDPDRVRLRKYINLLSISGIAVIAFGIWSVLKLLIFFLLNKDIIMSEIEELIEDTDTSTSAVLVAAIILMLISLTLHCIIGFSARSEARGKKKGYFYLILTAVIFILSLISFIQTSLSPTSEDNLDTIVSGGLIDLTMLFAFFEVILNSVRIKKLRKKADQEEQPCR